MMKSTWKRYVRYLSEDKVCYGIRFNEEVHELDGELFSDPEVTGKVLGMAGLRLLLPIDPLRVGKVIGVPGNYNRIDENPRNVLHPRWFNKFPTSLNPHDADVERPKSAANFNFEGELVVVIGKMGRHIPLSKVPEYVFGVAVGNDWSENSWIREKASVGDDQGRLYLESPNRLISKSMDTWACLGSEIVSGIAYDEYMDLGLEVRLNGELAAKGRTRDMINNVRELIHYLSYFCTLLPGDMIYTGTVAPPSLPGIRKEIQDGDVVEVDLEHIGLLRNRVVDIVQPAPVIGIESR